MSYPQAKNSMPIPVSAVWQMCRGRAWWTGRRAWCH